MKEKRIKRLALLNLLAFIIMVTVNALANILPINGLTTGELSDGIENLFVPTGLTFAIWGLIYALLGVFVVYQFIAIRNRRNTLFIDDIGILFIINALANTAWIVSWHYRHVVMSLVLMLIILVTLILISLRQTTYRWVELSERFSVNLTFDVYLGWISVATIANITAVLVVFKWGGFGISPQIWTMIVIGVAIALAMMGVFLKKKLAFALVIDWAILGIFLKRYTLEGVMYPGIIWITIIGMVCITLSVIYAMFGKSRYDRRVNI